MNNLSFAELRTRHPRFVYQSYRMEHDSGELRLAYSFRLEPDISFEPQITLPCAQPEILPQLENMVFQLGLVEMISYWKAACPPVIEIPCGSLNGGQIAWWKDLLLHGLGEFFLRNAIDFRAPDFLRFDISASLPPGSQAPAFSPDDAELILVGGGKDSALTIELLRGLPKQRAAFMLNPMPSSIKSATLGGITRQLIARRRIDPRLLELNRSGYLNGHTPFSAYLAFASTLVAAANGFRYIISSNEWSANEANAHYLGLPVNHQYSKSYRFEMRFREYARSYLAHDIQYFSFLRPLVDLQISRLLSRFPAQLQVIRSCNANRKHDSWCGRCPKCAFVYLCFFPFLERDVIHAIFGQDLFGCPEALGHIRALLDIDSNKPFECVGTVRECEAAIMLAAQKYRLRGDRIPQAMQAMLDIVLQRSNTKIDLSAVLNFWSNEHALPDEYAVLLNNSLAHD